MSSACCNDVLQYSYAGFDRFEVKNYHLSLINWKTSLTSPVGQVQVYASAQHQWRKIAELLGFEPGDIESIRRNKYDDGERVSCVFHRWFDNANKLPNASKYPKTWTGLIRLLSDSGLGDLADKLRKALSAPFSDVRGNLS